MIPPTVCDGCKKPIPPTPYYGDQQTIWTIGYSHPEFGSNKTLDFCSPACIMLWAKLQAEFGSKLDSRGMIQTRSEEGQE